MMKGVTALLLVAAIGFAAAVEVKISAVGNSFRNVFLSGARTTRQDKSCTLQEAQQLLESFNKDCAPALDAVDDTLLEQLDPAEFKALGDVICQPRCGNPYIQYNRKCVGDPAGQQMINTVLQLCGTNSQGKSCYSADVINALRSGFGNCEAVPATCTCSSIQAGINSVGCCINVVDEGGAANITGFLKTVCSDLNIPDPCEKSSLSGAMAPIVHMGTIFGTLAVLFSLVVL